MVKPLWSARETRLCLAVFAALTALVALFLLRSGVEFVSTRRIQVLGHTGASAALTTAFAGSRLATTARRPDPLLVMGAGTVATLALELSQGLVPVRVVQLEDILIGLSGVLIAAIAIELALRAVALPIALRLHATAAAAASLGLLVVLLVGG